MNSNRITMSNLATKATLVCVSLQSLAGTASGVPVLITAPKTVENGAATITPTAGGAPVPLIDAEITVNGTTLTMNGRQKIASLSLQNAALRHEIQSISAVWGLELTVFGNVDVPQNSVINMSGTGWAGGGSLGAGALGNTTCGPGGGGHGGQGGNNNCGSGGGSSSDYPNEPTFFGGGGGYYVNSIGDYGGRGGGRIRLIVSGTITLGGIIDANGQLGYEAGGGAGGSIWINASAILGTGTIRADGGAQTGASGRGGGGGGRRGDAASGWQRDRRRGGDGAGVDGHRPRRVLLWRRGAGAGLRGQDGAGEGAFGDGQRAALAGGDRVVYAPRDP